jgi:hypothetical protein
LPVIETTRVPPAAATSTSIALNGSRPAQPAVAAERNGQRLPKQLAGRAAQQAADARRDIGEQIVRIDLPEPADPLLLIFAQQLADRLARGALLGHLLDLAREHGLHSQAAGQDHAQIAAQHQHEQRKRLGPGQIGGIEQSGGDHPRPHRRGDRHHREQERARHHRAQRAGDDELHRHGLPSHREQHERAPQP